MKKFFIWFMVIVVILLSTFKYHLGRIPVVNQFVNYYVLKYFDSSQYDMIIYHSDNPLLAKALIFMGAEIDQKDSYRTSLLKLLIDKYESLESEVKEELKFSRYDGDKTSHEKRDKQKNNFKIIKILLENGVDTKGALSYTSNMKITKLLLEYGADASEENLLVEKVRYTSDDKIAIINLLIDRGADIYAKSMSKETLLHLSFSPKLIKLLIDKGLDVNAKDNKGNTPLFTVAKYSDKTLPAVKVLLDNGADINAQNNKGQTALEYMLESRYARTLNQIPAYLLKRGAKVNDNIYVNAFNFKKIDNVPDESLSKKLLKLYKKININDKYDLYEAIDKMGDKIFPKEIDRYNTMKYLINIDFVKQVMQHYTKEISTIYNTEGATPLHYTVRNSIELTKYFLENGVDVNAKNKKGQTALFFADNIETVKLLLEYGADLSILDKDSKGAIDYIKNPKVLNYIISNGSTVAKKDTRGNSPFINYVQKNRPIFGYRISNEEENKRYYNTIKVFLENGANINEQISDSNETVLFFIKDKKLLNLLIENGINTEIRDRHGRTAIFNFMKFPYVEMGKELINQNVNIQVKENLGNTLLHYVEDYDIAKILIERGLDVNAQNKFGHTPLHKLVSSSTYKCRDSKKSIFNLFIKSGAKVNQKDKKGLTALTVAIDNNNEQYIKELIDAGADTNVKDNNGRTLLFYAKNLKMIKILLDEGIDIDSKDNRGRTALDYAYSAKVKNFLIEKGAKFSK